MKTDEQAARSYIADMCKQLAALAEKNQLILTAHLLEMAEISTIGTQGSQQLTKCH